MATSKFIFITGTSSGLGFALAQKLTVEGFQVIAGIRKEKDAQLFQDNRIKPLICDVAKPEDFGRVYNELNDITNGAGLFGLINNAGINYLSPFETAQEQKERAVFEVNLLGPMGLTRKLLPLLHQYVGKHRQRAKIINIGSIGSIFGLPWEAAYHASKFALLGWSQSLRFELEALQIDVTCFLPGGMKTNIFKKSISAPSSIIPKEHPHQNYYHNNLELMHQTMMRFEKSAATAENAAQAVLKLLHKKRPPLKAYFGWDAFFIRTLVYLGMDHLLKNQFITHETKS